MTWCLQMQDLEARVAQSQLLSSFPGGRAVGWAGEAPKAREPGPVHPEVSTTATILAPLELKGGLRQV